MIEGYQKDNLELANALKLLEEQNSNLYVSE